jgi:hypothetical protein
LGTSLTGKALLQDRGDDRLGRQRLLRQRAPAPRPRVLRRRAPAPRISPVRTRGIFDPLHLGPAARIERLPLPASWREEAIMLEFVGEGLAAGVSSTMPALLLRGPRSPPPRRAALAPRRRPRALASLFTARGRLSPSPLRADAFEERGDAILHPLSPQYAFCLTLCLSCWREIRPCTVPTRDAKMEMHVLLDSV